MEELCAMTTPQIAKAAVTNVPGAPALQDDGPDLRAAGPELVREEDGFTASIFPGPGGLVPARLVEPIRRLQELLDEPLWLIVQMRHDDTPWSHLEDGVRDSFLGSRVELRKFKRVGLILDTPGGSAGAAYQIASMFRRHCGRFDCIVPRYAKSAGTLLALGGSRLYMGSDAELGPLDAQFMDPDRENWGSALDEVQALERLNAASLEQADQAMIMLLQRTGKKIETLLPIAMKFATDMARPLLERLDTVHYTQQSRLLKVAEDYAIRLLRPKYDVQRAEDIARRLVNHYPEHGFVIDRDEAKSFLDIEEPEPAIQDVIDEIEAFLTFNPLNAVGRISERTSDGE